jgi:hypothetical protein
MARPPRRPPTASASDLHRQWLELVDTDGPFLAIPPLKRVWPQGMPPLSDERKETLGYVRKDFENAWENFDRSAHDDASQDSYRVARNKWVETVLRDVAGWSESLSWGQVPGVQAQSPNRLVTVTADASLGGSDGIGALLYLVDPVDSLRETPNDLWAATPIDRMEALLRENNIQIGIVTDGRWWGLVCARPGSMTASGIVDALTWTEEPRTRDAFLAVIARQYIIGGDEFERLPVLFAESVAAAEEVTEALGAQVRRAVELLVQSFSESAAEARRHGLNDPLAADTHQTYEAAVTVMMRVVFLLFAEERGLLPAGELFEQSYGIARELDRLQAREIQEGDEALDATFLTWHRLLATSQALYRGASFEGMRMPAYGGSLFDPKRFPFLTRITDHGTLALTVSDRVMAQVLRSVQLAMLRGGEARRISFRDIDVEQIGYIYEGLLGYTAITVNELNLGLRGANGEEPEIPLSTLEALAIKDHDPKALAAAILSWTEGDQPAAKPQSLAAIARSIGAKPESTLVSALNQIVGHDSEMSQRIRRWLPLVRLDLRGRPMIVPSGGLMVKETPSRRNTGTHYTPRSLAEEVVLHALEPLCYLPGPLQTTEKSEWILKSSDDILRLKVADIACGSGAFLVSAARYLADRLVEAWVSEQPDTAQRSDLHLRAIREVVANCLYGADINDMAVEMCKLSLWLVSLDRDLPFSFVDDKIFLGNSLLGLTSLDQLRKLHIYPSQLPKSDMFEIFDVNIDSIIAEAVELRRNLASEIDELDPARNSAAKQRQLAELRRATDNLRTIADGVIAAGLRIGGKPGRVLDEAYENLRIAVRAAFPDAGDPDLTYLESIIANGLTPTVPTDNARWRPLHWVIEAPDIVVGRGGFDAIIGNPPFLVGKKIKAAIGTNVRDYCVATLANGKPGNTDIVSFFLLRGAVLTNGINGQLGLITSKVVAEGDTREVGLDQLGGLGFEVVRAVRSEAWPSSLVATRYSVIWATRAQVPQNLPRFIDGVPATRISPSLEDAANDALPQRLVENAGIAFKGYEFAGDHFLLDVAEGQRLLGANPRNADVVVPLVNGRDLNSSPTQSGSRYAIFFRDFSMADAEAYKEPFDFLWNRVASDGKVPEAKKWWQFRRKNPALTDFLDSCDTVLCIAVVSSYALPIRVPTRSIFSSAVVIVTQSDEATLAALSSSAHYLWAARWGSTLGLSLRYNVTDVFETFPRPRPTSRLASAGKALDSLRTRMMLDRELGITSLYNLVNDPNVTNDLQVGELRELCLEIDKAALDSYGWSDLKLDYGFHEYKQLTRFTIGPAVRTEMLSRLLQENLRRSAAENADQGIDRNNAKRVRATEVDQGGLF